jgi:S-adenosylmethionine/arginine decarboxylase-like enzyme
MALQHKHLIVHAEVTWNPGPTDVHKMTKWLKEMVEEIDMKILHGPIVIYSEVEGNEGMTGFCIIETSHIAFHHWVPEPGEEFGRLELDVYTCSTLDPMEVIQMLDIFEPESVSIKYLDRENGLTEIPLYDDTE